MTGPSLVAARRRAASPGMPTSTVDADGVPGGAPHLPRAVRPASRLEVTGEPDRLLNSFLSGLERVPARLTTQP
jgi:hypothetical protein